MKSRRRATSQLFIEPLEDRRLLTTFAAAWPEPDVISLSFAPDGTQVGTQTSALFGTLDSTSGTSAWQAETLRAFQTWAVNSNINIAVKNDGGQPFGTLGMKQGDARFGDIRVAAFPMAGDVVASADPYDPFVANTWVGDVFLNSTATFGIGGSPTDYDLFSVMLHEAGHAFGIGHSVDPTSPMFSLASSGDLQALTPADIENLQSLYGGRAQDAYDATASNDDPSQANELIWSDANGGATLTFVAGDITTAADVDYYRFTAPADGRLGEIRLTAAGVSLLTAQMSLLDADGKVINAVETKDPLRNDLVISTSGLTPEATYSIRIKGARSDVFGIGAYELTVSAEPPLSPLSRAEWSLSTTPPSALEFASLTSSAFTPVTTPGYVEHTYYEELGSLSSGNTSQVYRVRSADIDPSIRNVYTVLVTTPSEATGRLNVRLLDGLGHVQDAHVLYRNDGAIEVQIEAVESNRDYFIEISSADPSLQPVDFELTVDFDQDGGHLQPYVHDWLNSAEDSTYRTFVVLKSEQFHFVLSASDWNAAEESGIAMTVRDASGAAVLTWNVADGQARSMDVFVNQGTYTVEFSRSNTVSRQPVFFQLAGLGVSDPIGPQLRDTALSPVDASRESVEAGLTFYWLAGSAPPIASAKPDLTALGFGVAASVQSVQRHDFATVKSSLSSDGLESARRAIDLESTAGLKAERRSSDLQQRSGYGRLRRPPVAVKPDVQQQAPLEVEEAKKQGQVVPPESESQDKVVPTVVKETGRDAAPNVDNAYEVLPPKEAAPPSSNTPQPTDTSANVEVPKTGD